MERRNNNMSIGSLRKEEFNLQPDFQRGFVWKPEQQIALIDSLIKGFDICPIYLWVNDPNNEQGKMSVIDGQQRLTTIFRFLNNDLVLNVNKCKTLPQELNAMVFENMPKEYQDIINRYNLYFVEITATLDEVEQMFQRMQNGTKLKAVEIRNANSGKLRDFVKTCVDYDLFKAFKVNKNTMQIDEAIQQMLMLETNNYEPMSLKNKSVDVESFFQKYSVEGVPEKIQAHTREVLEFLSENVPDRTKKLFRRINIVPLYVTVSRNFKDIKKKKITSEKVWEWFAEFIDKKHTAPGCPYKCACGAGSADKDKVGTRLEIMNDDFVESFKLKAKKVEAKVEDEFEVQEVI